MAFTVVRELVHHEVVLEAVALAHAGADVVVNYVRGDEAAEQTVALAARCGARVYAHRADVSAGKTPPTAAPPNELRDLQKQRDDAIRNAIEQLRSQLFEPFVTTKPDGLGIGLAIAQTIVTAHGSRLEHREGADRGAVFAFSLAVAV